MEQQASLSIIGQSIIAELIDEYNALTEFRSHLFFWSETNAREDAYAEAAQAAYRHAMDVVARQMGINFKPKREVI